MSAHDVSDTPRAGQRKATNRCPLVRRTATSPAECVPPIVSAEAAPVGPVRFPARPASVLRCAGGSRRRRARRLAGGRGHWGRTGIGQRASRTNHRRKGLQAGMTMAQSRVPRNACNNRARPAVIRMCGSSSSQNAPPARSFSRRQRVGGENQTGGRRPARSRGEGLHARATTNTVNYSSEFPLAQDVLFG